MGIRRIAVAFVAMCAVTAAAREPDVKGFKSYAIPEFTIVTHDEVAARRLPPQITMIERVLARLVPGETRGGRVPNYILVIPPRLFVDYVDPEPCPFYVCSTFIPGRFANYIVVADTREPYWLRRAVFHQYTHWALHTRLRGIQPLWFDEGMAELAERIAFIGSKAIIGEGQLAFSGWLPIDQLLRLERESVDRRYFAGCSAASGNMQSSSWALVHRGLVADARFGEQIFSYLDAINDLKTVDEAAQESFGVSPAELNRVMYHYAMGGPLKNVRIEVGAFPAETRIPGEKLSELEMLELLANVMFTTGRMPERLAELVAAARRVAPDSPAVQILRMRRAARIRNDEAIGILLSEIEPQLSDPKVARGVGLALFERLNDPAPEASMKPLQRTVFRDRARDLLDRSLGAQPDDPEAAWAFGMLAASTKQLQGSAVQRLLTASLTTPENADISMALALVFESMDKPEKAVAHLHDTARFSRTAAHRAWALERIARATR